MIRLNKGAAPPILEERGAEWTAEFKTWIEQPVPRPTQPRRWVTAEVKAHLVAETASKCAYCESRVSHVYPGDVEHIHPKSVFPELVVVWENLTFACFSCNNAKREYYDAADPLVHPYADDPQDHIRFYGPQPVAAPNSAKGLVTIKTLALDRTELFDRRRDAIVRLTDLLDLWAAAPEGAVKEVRRAAIVALAEAHSEYAATVRWFLRATPEWPEEDLPR